MYYLRPGASAPMLEVVDPQSGASRTLEDLVAGGQTLLFWIKTSCPTCRLAAPFVDRLATRVAPGRVAVIAQDAPDAVARFRDEAGAPSVPIYCEAEPFEDADGYGLTHVPTWFLIRPDHTIAKSGMTFSQPDLEMLLADLGGSGDLFTADESDELPQTRPG